MEAGRLPGLQPVSAFIIEDQFAISKWKMFFLESIKLLIDMYSFDVYNVSAIIKQDE